MAKLDYDAVVAKLKGSQANLSCDEMKELLEALGFVVNKSSSGNHHTYTHPKLNDFHGGSFDGSHKKQMLSIYPRNALKIIRRYEDDLNPKDPPPEETPNP